MRTLDLQRPLAFFDLETTGLDVEHDRIVEICVITLHPNGDRTTKTRRIHPGMPIPAGATAVHGITDADVQDCPRFGQIARGLIELLSGCDLGGYNIERFDIKLLRAEFGRCQIAFPDADCKIIDAYTIFSARERRDLSAAVQFYCDRELVGAHSAQADVLATIDVLHGQLQRYADLPTAIADLHAHLHPVDPNAVDPEGRFVWQDDQVVFNFGTKQKGLSLQRVAQTDRGFLQWMLRADFAPQAKKIAHDALAGVFPQRSAAQIDGDSPK